MNGREVKECAGLAHPPTTAPVQVVVAQFVIRSAKAGGGGYECKVKGAGAGWVLRRWRWWVLTVYVVSAMLG